MRRHVLTNVVPQTRDSLSTARLNVNLEHTVEFIHYQPPVSIKHRNSETFLQKAATQVLITNHHSSHRHHLIATTHTHDRTPSTTPISSNYYVSSLFSVVHCRCHQTPNSRRHNAHINDFSNRSTQSMHEVGRTFWKQ